MNLQELCEVAAIDFIVGIAATHHILAHLLKDLWHVLNNFTRCYKILASISPTVSTGVINETVEVTPKSAHRLQFGMEEMFPTA